MNARSADRRCGKIGRASLFVLILFVLQSCGAQWHLKRAIAKDPTIAADTIVKIDTTIVTQGAQISDTLVLHDTIEKEIRTDGVIVKIQRFQDTIRIAAECLPDTIRLITEVPIDRVVLKKEKRPLFKEIRLILLLILLISVVILFIKMNT